MASSQKTFCSLPNYIKKIVPKFEELASQICLYGYLKGFQDTETTFVIPDKETIKHHLEEVESNDVEKLKAAQIFVKQHFFRGLFDSSKTSIQNGDKIDITYSAASDGTVTIDKCKLTPEDVQVGTGLRKVIKIMNQSSGKLHNCGKSKSGGRRGARRVRGGALYTKVDIEDMVRRTYTANFIYKKNNGVAFLNPYLAAMNSLFLYLKENHEDLYLDLVKIKDACPELNFYMFVQPFSSNSSILSEDIIKGWGGSLFDHMALTLDDIIDRDAEVSSVNNISLNDIVTCKSSYNSVQKSCLSSHLKNVDNLMLWCDVFRISHKASFLGLCNEPDCGSKIASIAQSIKDSQPGMDYNKEIERMWDKRHGSSQVISGGSDGQWPYLNNPISMTSINNLDSMITTQGLANLDFIFDKNFTKNYNHKFCSNISFSKHLMLGFRLLEGNTSVSGGHGNSVEIEEDVEESDDYSMPKFDKSDDKTISYKSVL
jgi:hypothetical protein